MNDSYIRPLNGQIKPLATDAVHSKGLVLFLSIHCLLLLPSFCVGFVHDTVLRVDSSCVDWLQSLKQFFINVSYHVLAASLTLTALFLLLFFTSLLVVQPLWKRELVAFAISCDL